MLLDPKSLARRLGGEAVGNEIRCPGPGHKDPKDRSLSVKIDPRAPDSFVVHSFAGDDPIVCRDHVRDKGNLGAFKPNGQGRKQSTPSSGPQGVLDAAYDYKDENGDLLYQVLRLKPKDFRQRRPDGNGGWLNKLGDVRRVPYRLSDLMQYPSGTVFVCEGEKDADRVASLEQCATTVASGKWTDDCVKALAHRDVIVLQDNEAGQKKALAAAQALHGTAKSIRIVLLPDLPAGGDVSDWLNADTSRGADELARVCLDVPEWSPSASENIAEGADDKGWRAHTFTAASLENKVFPPTSFVVPGLFPEGVTILAGRPTVGKSWMALDVGVGLAAGRFVFGDIRLEEGDVLYAALEDNQRRLQSRLRKILAGVPWPERLTLVTRWRRLDNGGIDDAREWAASVKKPRLIIFDTLAGIRGERNAKDTTYDGDYRALQELQQWTGDARFGGLILHHTRKAESDDPIDAVSGTLGLAGCVDTVAILNRSNKGPTLYVRGRDVDEQEKALHFNKSNCRWTIIGEAREAHQTQSRNKILTLLQDVRKVSEPLGPKKIAAETDMTEDLPNQTLGRMVTDGEVIKVKRGFYIAASRDDLQK